MKKLLILLTLVLVVGCAEHKELAYTIKLSKEECDEYGGRGFHCGDDYEESTIKLSKYIKAVVSKKLSVEEDYSVGSYYSHEKEWSIWVWRAFKREDIVDRVDGYSKFKALTYYGKDTEVWVPNTCLFYYHDYRPKPPSPFKKIREDIVGRAKEEYKKMEGK